MKIVIERNLEQHLKIFNQQWIYKSKKTLILLSIMLLMGLSILFSEIINNNSTIGSFNPAFFFSAIIITYALTMLRAALVIKTNHLTNLKFQLSRNTQSLISINITENFISVIYPSYTTIFKWEAFTYYKVIKEKVFIDANPKNIGILINFDEISTSEKSELLIFLNNKGLQKI